MTVTISITQVDYALYLLRWSSDLPDPTYKVYIDGDLYQTTKQEELLYGVASGLTPVFEILDDNSDPGYARSSFPRLCWYAPADAVRHVIERQDGETWTELTDFENEDKRFLKYNAPALSDGKSATYRITPYDSAGNDGAAKTITFTMVRHPDPLDLTTAYDSDTQTLTFTEAS
jgi:hypothetical protein